MPTERVEFPSMTGLPLVGRLQRPVNAPRGWALFAHCFTCSKDSKAAYYIAQALMEAGFGVLRFDFTGLGESGGDFANTHFSSNVDDLVAAANWLRAHHGAPALLIGHSLGGSAVLAAAHRIPDAAALACIAALFDPADVTSQFGAQLQTIRSAGQAQVQLAGRSFTIKRELLDDLAAQNQQERIAALHRPLLILHAPADDVVAISNAAQIFTTARHPKSFVSLDDADHLLTRAADARYAAAIIAAWAGRYVDDTAGQPILAQPTDEAAAPLPTGVVRIAETATGTYTVAAQAGSHHWLIDEPQSLGGDDAGPGPYDLLSAALGACTVITMRMYANRKQWPVDKISVQLQHAKIHANDCAECETRVGRIDQIKRQIRIDGVLDTAQHKRLMEIADLCPVHRTLHSEVRILSTEDDSI